MIPEFLKRYVGRRQEFWRDGNLGLVVLNPIRFFLDPAYKGYMPQAERIFESLLGLARDFLRVGLPVYVVRQACQPGGCDFIQRWWGYPVYAGSPEAELFGQWQSLPVPVIDKNHYSAFHGTYLDNALLGDGVDVVVVAGVHADLSVVATVFDAVKFGFIPVVPWDGVASLDEELTRSSLVVMAHACAFVSSVADIRSVAGSGVA
jgi:nicotinamidase-related amidase